MCVLGLDNPLDLVPILTADYQLIFFIYIFKVISSFVGFKSKKSQKQCDKDHNN